MKILIKTINFFFKALKSFWISFLRAKKLGLKQEFLSDLEKIKQSLHKDMLWKSGIYHPSLGRLEQLSSGCASIPFENDLFSVSVLIPVFHPKLKYLEEAVVSVLNQGIDDFEVLLGFDGEHSSDYHGLVDELIRTHKNGFRIKSFEFDRKNGGGISSTTNQLAEKAQKKYLLLMDHDDWIRPDLLYRYRQAMHFRSVSPENTVIYCNEFKIDQFGYSIRGSLSIKPQKPVFPYLFCNWVCHALLIPKSFWIEVGGLRSERDGAQDYDLCLRLDLKGAGFYGVSLPLYAWRAHIGSTAMSINSKPKASTAGLESLRDYIAAKGLDWDCSEASAACTYRAIPKRSDTPEIQVIIPFRDQRELTLQAVRSVLAQEGAKLQVTCVDNNSSDSGLGADLKALDGRITVLKVNEPFNYSRLNNIAAKAASDEIPYILFLNNDVTLEAGSFTEMLRWIDQPSIGIVGCKLLYPDGKIQHGGVRLNPYGCSNELTWRNIDHGIPEDQGFFSRIPMIVDAVTAACALVKRKDFCAVGGFDERNFPLAYSDTDLCIKLRQINLYSFYTPYARGVHFESVSRGRCNIEDCERLSSFTRELRDGCVFDSLVPFYRDGKIPLAD